MGRASQLGPREVGARSIKFEDNLPSKQETRDPSPDGCQLYEPKMSSHIYFMLRSYLELQLECYRNN